MNGLGVGTASIGGGHVVASGHLLAYGNVIAYYSDDRLKKRLGNVEAALEKICSLKGFYYEANETAQALGYEAVRSVGISAQDLQKVLPEAVHPAPVDSQYLTADYARVVPLLIEAIKELSADLEMLKK